MCIKYIFSSDHGKWIGYWLTEDEEVSITMYEDGSWEMWDLSADSTDSDLYSTYSNVTIEIVSEENMADAPKVSTLVMKCEKKYTCYF